MSDDASHWRVFPWDPEAEDGAPFSASFVAPQGGGRFDVPGTPVLYLAERPEHAVAERIQPFRGSILMDFDLTPPPHRLALVEVTVSERAGAGVADCCDPTVLVALGQRPDTLASSDVTRSQAAAAVVHEQGHTGLRWWSSLSGDWHGTVLFLDRVDRTEMTWGAPVPLTLEHPALVAACAALGIRRWRQPRPGRPPGRRPRLRGA